MGNLKENSEERQKRRREEIDSVLTENEAVMLHNSDHLGMTLVSVPLIGSNYLSWSRSVKIALGAKMKLSFIDGSATPPEIDLPQFANWKKVDCMMLSWMLNSISKDISESFIYVDSSRDLWLQVETRFGESNSPTIYQIHREINTSSHGNLSVTQYYSKLKRLWDEFVGFNRSMQRKTAMVNLKKNYIK